MDRIPREVRPERSDARAPPHKRARIPRTRCQPNADSASPEHAYWPRGAEQAVVAFRLRLGHAPHSPSTSRRGREWAWAAVGPESCGQRRTCLPEPRAADQPVLATSTSSPRDGRRPVARPAVSRQTVRIRQLRESPTNQRTKAQSTARADFHSYWNPTRSRCAIFRLRLCSGMSSSESLDAAAAPPPRAARWAGGDAPALP